MKKLYFLLALSTISFLSCSKKCDKFSSNEHLTGNWKWVRTDGGIGDNIHDTPASTGKNINIRFTADNHYTIYTNGSITSQGTFIVEQRNCIHDNTNKDVINFSDPADQDMMIEKLENSFLESSDDVYDGTTSVYSKM